jgi:hypothetical protein
VSNFQVGKDEKLRQYESLMDSEKNTIQQRLLVNMGSVDLVICQGSSGSIPYCQVGRDGQRNLGHQVQLIEE